MDNLDLLEWRLRLMLKIYDLAILKYKIMQSHYDRWGKDYPVIYSIHDQDCSIFTDDELTDIKYDYFIMN